MERPGRTKEGRSERVWKQVLKYQTEIESRTEVRKNEMHDDLIRRLTGQSQT